jgi:alpha-L-rhamnosidase
MRNGLSRRGFLTAAAAGAGVAAVGWPSGSARVAAAPAGASDVPSSLLTALRDDPVGIPSATPRLWWQVPVRPGHDGGRQSGYEIQLTRDPRGFALGARAETTRVVNSAASTAVAWPFAPLRPRQVAHWRVRVRVGSGAGRWTGWSAPIRVVLGPLADGDWAGAASLWAPTPHTPTYGDAVFTASLQIRQLRAGVFVRMSNDLRNGYMWQLVAGSPGVLRRHVVVNGTYTVLAEITLPVAIPTAAAFAVRVEANGGTITTSINGQVVDTATGLNDTPGAFGFRTGSTESFWADDVVITDLAGNSLYRNDFSTPSDLPPFGSLDGGRLLVGVSTAGVLGVPGPDDWALVRKEFALPPGRIAGAYLYASAQSPDGARQHVYRAWCNGQHAGVGPARSVDGPRYQVHDISDIVRAGQTNAVAFQCWTRSGRQVQALLDVHYADGRIVTVTTGSGWTARTGGSWLPWAGDFKTPFYVAPNEAFDARNEPVGWRDAGYSGTDFAPAVVGDPISGLAPGEAAAIERVEHRPSPLTKLADGQWLLDTGRELTAGLRLTLEIPAALSGTTVEVRLGEERNGDGSVRYNLRAQTTYREVWTLRAGRQVIEHWGYREFRWGQLITDPALDLSRAVTLLEQVVPQPDQVAQFESSDADLNRVWQLCAYTIAANRQDLHMDSATRERDAYEGDLVVHGRGEMALSRSYDIVRQTNRFLLRRPTWPTEYKFMTITSAWEEYLETGDPDALAADFDLHAAEQGERWLGPDGLIHKDPGGSSQNNSDIVDWPVSQRDGYVFTNVNTVVNSWQYQAFVRLQQAATVLGRTDDADRYATLARTMRATVNAQLYDGTAGAYYDGIGTSHQAQHASLYPAALGVALDGELPKIANWLASDSANPVRVSANAVQWLLEALFLGGRADAAVEIMTSDRDTSWLAMMDTWGATQTMEAWSPAVKSNTTFSHPWASAPANVIPRYLLGVRVVEAGGARIEVAPQPGNLARVRGTVATVRGLVGVDIEQSPRCRVAVTVPGNVTGTLRWPLAGRRPDQFLVLTPTGPRPVSVDGHDLIVGLDPGRTDVLAR